MYLASNATSDKNCRKLKKKNYQNEKNSAILIHKFPYL
jgi:hypothetical protein